MAMLLYILALVATTQAVPTLNYPLMAQQPPVARVGKQYVFDLLPSTFTSTSNITYTSSSLPSWLSFSPGVETFYGTPSATDVGERDITLTATDSTGSTSSIWRLIVSNYSAPGVHSAFTTQIANPPLRVFSSASVLPGNTGVSIPPYWSFSLGFAADTFRTALNGSINYNLFYSARQRGSTSLPSWLNFNNETFTFEGVAPANGTYTIVGTASDYWGYTGAQTSFVIQVGQGQAVEWVNRTAKWTNAVGISRGKLDYTVDMTKFMVGGRAVDPSALTLSLNKAEFPWLSLDPSTRKLTGIVPDQYRNGTISPYSVPFTVGSTNASNTLSLTAWLGLDIVPFLYTAFDLPNSTINPGSAYSFNLSPYLLNTTASVTSLAVISDSDLTRRAPAGTTVNAAVTPSDAASWLKFDPSTLTVSGTSPSNPAYNAVDVAFTAVQGAYSATSNLKINLSGVTPTSSTSGSAAVPSSPTSSGNTSSGGLSNAAKIGLGVGLGLAGLLLLLLLLFCCCRRRRKSTKEEKDNDGDSIVAASPVQAQDPFRRSNTLDPPRNLLGEIARFTPFSGLRSPPPNPASPRSLDTYETAVEKPHRIDPLKGIIDWQEKSPIQSTPHMNRSNSFVAAGDVIGVSDPVNRPSQDASSFTDSLGSSSSSRASWESRQSFHWSSGENVPNSQSQADLEGNRLSTAASIPRPRQNFTPRYPRNNSPSRLARLTEVENGVRPDESPDFSEFDSEEQDHRDSFSQSPGLGSGSLTGSPFPSGPSGLNRFGESSGQFATDDEGEMTDHEGPAVVALAQRQSFETRRPRTAERPVPKWRPSRERVSTIEERKRERSEKAFSGMGAFDDAEEARRMSTYAPSTSNGEVRGLGYPISEIYFTSPSPAEKRFSGGILSDGGASTITAVPMSDHQHPMSPPLPQVGSFIRPRSNEMSPPPASIIVPEGRIAAIANETFSVHPQIHPPPTVSLSAATWSSNPPSTYRAIAEGGLPKWLHFDSKALELWGVPSLANSGDVTVIRIMEKLPNKRRSGDPMSFGYQPPQEREVGIVTIEVVDRMKSPQFALDGSPHAL